MTSIDILVGVRVALLLLTVGILYAFWPRTRRFALAFTTSGVRASDVLAGGLWLITAGSLGANVIQAGNLLQMFSLTTSLTLVLTLLVMNAGCFLIFAAWYSSVTNRPARDVCARCFAGFGGAGVLAAVASWWL